MFPSRSAGFIRTISVTGVVIAGAGFLLSGAAIASEPSQQVQAIAGTVLIHDDCARAFSKLAERMAGDYAAWTARNRDALATIDANAKYSAQLHEDQARIRDARDAGVPGAPGMDSEFCEGFFDANFRSSATATASSPGEAWNGFLAQLRNGDAQKALTFLTGDARGRFRPVFEAMGTQELRKAADAFAELDSYEMAGDVAFGHMIRAHADGKREAFEVGFLRDRRSGHWFIDSM
jgi:hypothetical protein